MSDIEARVERLERAFGAAGTNIHEFDDADQAAATAKEADANAKLAAEQQKQLQEAADQRAADSVQAQAEADAPPAKTTSKAGH